MSMQKVYHIIGHLCAIMKKRDTRVEEGPFYSVGRL